MNDLITSQTHSVYCDTVFQQKQSKLILLDSSLQTVSNKFISQVSTCPSAYESFNVTNVVNDTVRLSFT